MGWKFQYHVWDSSLWDQQNNINNIDCCHWCWFTTRIRWWDPVAKDITHFGYRTQRSQAGIELTASTLLASICKWWKVLRSPLGDKSHQWSHPTLSNSVLPARHDVPTAARVAWLLGGQPITLWLNLRPAYEIKHVWYYKPSQKLMAVGIQNPGRKDTAEVLLSEHVV